MKKLIICTAMAVAFLSTSAAFASGFDPLYVMVEIVPGCGATTGQPAWTSENFFNVSPYYPTNQWGTSGHAVSWSFPQTDIDSVRVKVKCYHCQFYNHDGWNWRWYDTVQNSWRQSCDLEGYYSHNDDAYYYRAEEKYSICDDDYSYAEPIMKVYWNVGYPRDKYKTIFHYPGAIVE